MAAEWSGENVRILTELFVQEVYAGNQPNTHLTVNAFEGVAKDFKTRTGLEYSRLQLNNNWDKLKTDYANWKKLKLKETGGGWDYERNTVKQDAEWWKKAKKDIPGCSKFQKHGIQNEDNLRIMFEDITSHGTDHWNPTSGGISRSSNLAASFCNLDDIQHLDLEQQEESPFSANGKRLGKFVDDKHKKPKTSQVMQKQIIKIGDIAERTQIFIGVLHEE